MTTIAGYLGAAGIQAALIRRAKEGGSYHVRVNLARAAMFFMSLGTFDKNAPAPHRRATPNPVAGHQSPRKPPTENWSDSPRR